MCTFNIRHSATRPLGHTAKIKHTNISSVFSSSGSLPEKQPMQRLQTFQLYFLQDCEREYVYSRSTYTHSNLWNVLIIGLQEFNYLIHGTNEFSKKLTILSSNRQFLLGLFYPAKTFSLVLPTPYTSFQLPCTRVSS